MQVKKNPAMALLKSVQEAKEMMKKATEDELNRIEEKFIDFQNRLQAEIEIIRSQKQEIIDEVAKKTDKLPVTELLKGIPQIKGEKGDKGDQGEIGFKGDTGDQGIKGNDSIIQGPKGDIGEKGMDGINGKKGKDGSSDTAEQIATKVNTLEDKIERKTIKGLENEFLKLYKEISGIARFNKATKQSSGGGMGNTQHQVFNISSGTTSVTTTFPIAGAGNAIFNFTYENARLEMTNHYTVGSDNKTITFDADVQAQFENNTTAAITFIRG